MIISQTPLRISFAGGGTDLSVFYKEEEGWVISSSIDKYVYVIIKERFDDKIYVNYSKNQEIVDSVDEIQHDLVREAMLRAGIVNGVEISTLADIPSEGSGLGSSSSVTVGLLNACYTYMGISKPAEDLAREACEIEIDVVGKPIGKQDQYIAAYGGIRFFRFKPDDTVEVEKINLENGIKRKFGSNLLLFFTGTTRDANAILEKQKERSTNGAFTALKEIKSHAKMTRELLESRRFEDVGNLLHQTWLSKKTLTDGISNFTIETMYEKARKAGALGGKVSGAGGGGFLLLYVPREKQDSVREALNQYREFPFFLEQYGSKIIFNYGGYEWK
ncbi:MAG: GHMP kinase [bacterium]